MQAIVCGNGLDGHHRQVVRMRLHGRFEGVEVVEGQTSVSRAYASGTPAEVVYRGSPSTARLDQQGVHVTVIAPSNFKDLGLSGHPTSQSDRAHGRFRSTGDDGVPMRSA